MAPNKIDTQGDSNVGVIDGVFEGDGFAGGSGGSQTPQTNQWSPQAPPNQPKPLPPGTPTRAVSGLDPRLSRGRGFRVVAVNMDTYRFLSIFMRASSHTETRRRVA